MNLDRSKYVLKCIENNYWSIKLSLIQLSLLVIINPGTLFLEKHCTENNDLYLHKQQEAD